MTPPVIGDIVVCAKAVYLQGMRVTKGSKWKVSNIVKGDGRKTIILTEYKNKCNIAFRRNAKTIQISHVAFEVLFEYYKMYW